MSTVTTREPSAPRTSATPTRAAHAAGGTRESRTRIPFGRLLWVELTKMFDTRSGFWLLAGIGASAVVATGLVMTLGPEDVQVYSSYAAAIGVPMSILLPLMAVLAVTTEWSQRSVLTTFTLEPRRSRVLAAKAVCAIAVGALSMLAALGIAALGHLLGSALGDTPTVWDITAQNVATLVLANVIGLVMGFTLGVVLRSSPTAIVAFFVWSLVLPNALYVLGTVQEGFADVQPWIDFYYATNPLYEDVPTGEQWAQLATSGTLWLVLPLAFGLWRVHRAEVK
ncbi:ABC transporter permease subunit [Nocardioides campestrisoli]|uniref:ABC transporter permease subunit n=1 Tax=Nocardioides campestrisoli TaxID=2736757 RepID=UPI0015E71606|nr:ABC transporter permease subunit [Nocardioides campestrisoli]